MPGHQRTSRRSAQRLQLRTCSHRIRRALLLSRRLATRRAVRSRGRSRVRRVRANSRSQSANAPSLRTRGVAMRKSTAFSYRQTLARILSILTTYNNQMTWLLTRHHTVALLQALVVHIQLFRFAAYE